jgi:methyltransferase (TIGR00027 family)
MRPERRSWTSDWVAALRALYSEAPAELAVLDDPAAVELIPPALGALVRTAARLPLGTRALHRGLGAASLGLTYVIPLRTAAIDEAVRASVKVGISQLVILGAGLDARAWRMPELEQAIVFELDHPATQAYKQARMPDLPAFAREVRQAAIDFERQSIGEVLREAGFEPERPSFWIWEGVTMYLTRAAIEATLDALGELAASGSRLAVTYIPPDFGPAWMKAVGSIAARMIGESLEARLEPAELAGWLESRGFRVQSDESALEWAARFWPKREARRVRAYERLALAVRR